MLQLVYVCVRGRRVVCAWCMSECVCISLLQSLYRVNKFVRCFLCINVGMYEPGYSADETISISKYRVCIF